MGVRADESRRRAKTWKTATMHRRTKEFVIAPLLYWSDSHGWEFIKSRGIPYCSLYDEGFKRLGCVGCPMAGSAGRKREFARWPKYERAWRQGFEHYWNHRIAEQPKQVDGREWFGSARFGSAQEMWDWWLSDEPLPGVDDCQGTLELWSAGADDDPPVEVKT